VICISHLAQVAVYADSHFRVQKQVKGERTETTIERLDEKQSTEEIAKLLSAGEVSNPSLANARNLMKKARGIALEPRV
jgi:DNA repair protein RecN (Recombination protein N)